MQHNLTQFCKAIIKVIHYAQHQLKVLIEDNGRGFDTHQPHRPAEYAAAGKSNGWNPDGSVGTGAGNQARTDGDLPVSGSPLISLSDLPTLGYCLSLPV